jgi:predicted dithiol-disulfide oxidoreductase (DUF899 family)
MALENHPVVSREQWLALRKQLLEKEKAFTRQREELNRERRALPWVKVDKPYLFDGPGRTETLAELFGKRSQLVVYHFMFPPEWEAGCVHCSFWADSFNPIGVHLNHRDTAFVAISRAPLATIEAFQRRMGWTFHWVSSARNDFNDDYHVSFHPEDLKSGAAIYNYGTTDAGMTDREGVSVFYKDRSGAVFHTYSSYARGIDMLNGTYQFLDLVPKGRDEANLPSHSAWLSRHDEYKD